MAERLARLRTNLDFMPSPIDDRPGLLIRDSYRYSDATLIIPPQLIECVALFDGENTDLDLKRALVELTGELDVRDLQEHLADTLSRAGFLEDAAFEQLREARHREFAESPVREPVHAGSGYPDERPELDETMARYLAGDAGAATDGNLVAIAAPHVSPFGGWQSYQAGYRALAEEHRERTFVVLGTSHYGAPDKFGLTRKPYVTPYGTPRVATEMVDWLAKRAPGAVEMEDYCHAVEHSVEFQVVFLQHLFGADVRVLPVLCGSFARSIYEGGMPEDNEDVRRFIDALGEMAETRRREVVFVLGIDMAHMGRRYGDRFTALAGRGEMEAVAVRDRARIERIAAGDADGFWSMVQDNRDDLKWCGSSPVYTFLRAVPGARGELRRYEQWNIDEASVVSFAGMAFTIEGCSSPG